MSEPCVDPNVRNHLAFLATHRGKLIEDRTGFALKGQASFLSFFAPLNGSATIRPDCRAMWLYPWSDEGWPHRLSTAGFVAAERMSYMQLEARPGPGARIAPTIERVRTDAAAAQFASVQERGFLTDATEQRDWWASCFRRMAKRNYARVDQDFLLARTNREPAAVLLTVRTGDTTGIYAVATIPEQRGKGLSSALLNRAIDRAAGAERIVLQVMAGSYAHDFYRRRGFEDRFACQVWRR